MAIDLFNKIEAALNRSSSINVYSIEFVLKWIPYFISNVSSAFDYFETAVFYC